MWSRLLSIVSINELNEIKYHHISIKISIEHCKGFQCLPIILMQLFFFYIVLKIVYSIQYFCLNKLDIIQLLKSFSNGIKQKLYGGKEILANLFICPFFFSRNFSAFSGKNTLYFQVKSKHFSKITGDSMIQQQQRNTLFLSIHSKEYRFVVPFIEIPSRFKTAKKISFSSISNEQPWDCSEKSQRSKRANKKNSAFFLRRLLLFFLLPLLLLLSPRKMLDQKSKIVHVQRNNRPKNNDQHSYFSFFFIHFFHLFSFIPKNEISMGFGNCIRKMGKAK